jgi:hypothetical protein
LAKSKAKLASEVARLSAQVEQSRDDLYKANALNFELNGQLTTQKQALLQHLNTQQELESVARENEKLRQRNN